LVAVLAGKLHGGGGVVLDHPPPPTREQRADFVGLFEAYKKWREEIRRVRAEDRIVG
jgi:hypothetical protein